MSFVGDHVFNGFVLKVNQIIKNTQRTTTSNLNAIQQTVHNISRPQAFLVATFFKMSSVGHLIFDGFFSKVNQIIRNTQRTTTSNVNAIQQTFHKISRPQAFRVAIFFKMSSVSHLIFNGFFSKVNQIIRNSQRTTTLNMNATEQKIQNTTNWWMDW